MNLKDFVTEIYPRVLKFKAAYHGLLRPPTPITLTFSVTNLCQSHCKTCNIWRIYPDHKQNLKDELTVEEIDRIFKSIGHVYFFNLSGGEPFLRKDLVDIVDSAISRLSPSIIHSPTNGIATKTILEKTSQILELVKRKRLDTTVTIKPSLDGIGEMHDQIRGFPGNWQKLLNTINGLKDLEQRYPNFHLEIGTVVSNFNKAHLNEIEDFVHGIGIQSYRNEIAEQREEFLNIGDPITPTGEEYADLMKRFSDKIRRNLKTKRSLALVTESLRLVYYDLASKIMIEKRQVIPCYAGISNVHITPYGDIWPCCTLGYHSSLGNLRYTNYDFRTLWHGNDAQTIRRSIKNRDCFCPLANQVYSNLICDTVSMFKVMRTLAQTHFH